MDTINTIKNRHSTRIFKRKPIAVKEINKIITSATYAPSPKNDQPWHFTVVTGEKINDLADILNQSLTSLKAFYSNQNANRLDIDFAFETVNVIRSASVVILISLRDDVYIAHDDNVNWNLHALDIECTHIQAIGAAIQNMLLTATDLGIGSVWLGDIFYGYNNIMKFVNGLYPLMAAVALGYEEDNISYSRTSRKSINSVTTWL